MANANVVLKISSDVGNAITGVKSFIDIVGMATRVIIDFAKENDKFANAVNRATIDIKEADEATAGLIETTQLYVQQQKLANAGLYLTEKQYRAVAVAAAEQGKITGDSTAEFLRLTEALTKGSPEAFRALGLDIKMTNGLMNAQSDILEALVNNFGDATVSAETFSEGIYALGNNLSTTTGHLWNNISQFTGLNTVLNTLNEALSDNNRAAEMGIGFWDAMAVKIGNYKEGLVSIMQPLADAENAIRRFFDIEGIGFITSGQIGMLEESMAARQAVQDKHDAFNAKRAAQQKNQRDRAFMSSHSKFLAGMITGGGKSRSGGGGRSRKESDPLDFVTNQWTEEEERALREQQLNDLLSRTASTSDPEFETGGYLEDIEFQEGPEQFSREESEARREESREKFIAWQAEKAELEKAEHSEWVERWNIKTNMASTWGEAWIDMIDQVDTKSAILGTTWRGMEDITRSVTATIAKGGKTTVTEWAKMVKGIVLNIGIEAQVQALMNLAKAIAEGVSSWGASPRVEGFAAAAAAYQATAAAAFAIAGGAGAIARKYKGSGGSGGATGVDKNSSVRDYSDMMAGRQDPNGGQNITIVLEGDADGLFRQVYATNEQKKQSGERSL